MSPITCQFQSLHGPRMPRGVICRWYNQEAVESYLMLLGQPALAVSFHLPFPPPLFLLLPSGQYPLWSHTLGVGLVFRGGSDEIPALGAFVHTGLVQPQGGASHDRFPSLAARRFTAEVGTERTEGARQGPVSTRWGIRHHRSGCRVCSLSYVVKKRKPGFLCSERFLQFLH